VPTWIADSVEVPVITLFAIKVIEHLVVRRWNPRCGDYLKSDPRGRLHHDMVVGDGGVLQRVPRRAADQQIDPQSPAGGGNGDRVAHNQDMVPGVPRHLGGYLRCGTGFAKSWIHRDTLILDTRHHQVADGDIGERLPGGRGELEFRRGTLDPDIGSVLEREAIDGIASGNDTKPCW